MGLHDIISTIHVAHNVTLHNETTSTLHAGNVSGLTEAHKHRVAAAFRSPSAATGSSELASHGSSAAAVADVWNSPTSRAIIPKTPRGRRTQQQRVIRWPLLLMFFSKMSSKTADRRVMQRFSFVHHYSCLLTNERRRVAWTRGVDVGWRAQSRSLVACAADSVRSESWLLGFHYHLAVPVLTPPDKEEGKLQHSALQGRAGKESDSGALWAPQEIWSWEEGVGVCVCVSACGTKVAPRLYVPPLQHTGGGVLTMGGEGRGERAPLFADLCNNQKHASVNFLHFCITCCTLWINCHNLNTISTVSAESNVDFMLQGR